MKASIGGYARARSIEHALSLFAEADGAGRYLAGGQSLVAALNLGASAGDMLVDISGIEALRGVRIEGDRLVIGALTRHSEIERNDLVARHVPLLAKAAPLIAHDAIRNRGTIGGSLSHADPAAEYPACAVALDAIFNLEGPNGRRDVAASEFFKGLFETDRAEDEILTAVSVPVAQAGERHAILELTRRSGDYALAGLAIVVRGDRHRIGAFGLGDRPLLCEGAMAALDRGDVDAAATAIADDVDPMSDIQASADYRRHLAGVVLRRLAAELGVAR
ncbi:xanthine dehydrogenase family protein subunit M [Fulvimarina endophytica]|uniref:Xanthine dehydrogenase family protein subunit M n=1 Tax=Fulvimarina endophytica TaxID=2293836 RepID=A0A371X2U7_9HYPH|nr:xanthine dehydrogenase family protein subunit M [Fulvimarina endophytica]RFC63536.1 xanthine dehydrogenase family protein subunit M [Fulvimarina endophytica]